MAKVKVKTIYKDTVLKKRMLKGDVVEATLERALQLEKAKVGAIQYDSLTVSELKEVLDDRGIEYTKKDKKDDLIGLLK